MSTTTVIKSLAQKNNNNSFSSPYPIGADAQYISMQSQLNLEEELKLGGNKVTMVSMSTFPSSTITYHRIREYYSDDIIQTTLVQGRPTIANASTASIKHTVETNIYTGGLSIISPIRVGSFDDTINEAQVLADDNPYDPSRELIVSIQDQFAANPNTSMIYISNIYTGYKSLEFLQSTASINSILHQKKVTMASSTYSIGG